MEKHRDLQHASIGDAMRGSPPSARDTDNLARIVALMDDGRASGVRVHR